MVPEGGRDNTGSRPAAFMKKQARSSHDPRGLSIPRYGAVVRREERLVGYKGKPAVALDIIHLASEASQPSDCRDTTIDSQSRATHGRVSLHGNLRHIQTES